MESADQPIHIAERTHIVECLDHPNAPVFAEDGRCAAPGCERSVERIAYVTIRAADFEALQS